MNKTWVVSEWNSQAEFWYKQCLSSTTKNYKIGSHLSSIPNFTNDFRGWIKATNWICIVMVFRACRVR